MATSPSDLTPPTIDPGAGPEAPVAAAAATTATATTTMTNTSVAAHTSASSTEDAPASEPTSPAPGGHSHHFQFPRLSLHHLSLKSHAHHPPISAPQPLPAFAPPTDIRETRRAYHIEIEVPGVTDREAIMIQWMSPHTLLVQGDIKRPADIGYGIPPQGEKTWEGDDEGWPVSVGRGQTEPEDGGPCVRTASRETIEAEILADSIPTLLLGERKIGSWRRTFTLPEDVMMKELKTRLEGGLLRITLPKRSAEDTELLRGGGVKIEIED